MKTFSLITATLMLALILSAICLAQTTTRYVSTTGINTDPTSATSWATSTTNLQGAIDAPGVTQVWVAAGVYKPTTTTGPASRTISFSMKNGVAMYGGFVGTESALTQRPTINPVSGNPSNTTLSGDIGTPNSTSDNSYHVISNPSGLTTTAILDGFVLTGGWADGSFPQNSGGAIFNAGTGNGQFCSPTIRNCAFYANAAAKGGAIFNEGSYDGRCNPVIINCAFQNNSAASDGGAIFNEGDYGTSSPVLTNCSFQANSANNGGAIYNNGPDGNSSPVLTNCAFLFNTASNFGGVLFNLATSSPVLTNCSFLSNSASSFGGAIFSDDDSGNSNLKLTNCVLFNNGGSNTIFNDDATLTASYSLFEPESVTVTGVDVSGPGNLTNVTTSPFVSTSSVALAPCSPAINAGLTSATGLTGINTDLTGNPRISGGTVDMGAVEFQELSVITSIASLTADESTCPVRLVGRATGTSFVFTNAQGYVFSSVYRQPGTYDVLGLGIKHPGTYTLTATYTNECGTSTPVSQTVTVSRSCP